LFNLYLCVRFSGNKGGSGKQGNVGTRLFWQTTKQGGSGKNETLKTKAVLMTKETWEWLANKKTKVELCT
jgi:hypothetical protein